MCVCVWGCLACICVYQHFIDIICREVSMSMMLHSYFFSHFGVVSFRRLLFSTYCCYPRWIDDIKTTLSFDNQTHNQKNTHTPTASVTTNWSSIHTESQQESFCIQCVDSLDSGTFCEHHYHKTDNDWNESGQNRNKEENRIKNTNNNNNIRMQTETNYNWLCHLYMKW